MNTQPTDAVKKLMSPAAYAGYCAGCVLQRLYDWQNGADVEALKSAQVYLTWLIDTVNSNGGVTSEQLLLRRGR